MNNSQVDCVAASRSAHNQETIDALQRSIKAKNTKPTAADEHQKLGNFGSSRPVSVSSGNSIQSMQSGFSVSNSHAGDSQASLSTMPTPRNTFLYPPTGISLSVKGSIQSNAPSLVATPPPTSTIAGWDSLQHQQQLQKLLEQKGVPRSDSFQSCNYGTANHSEVNESVSGSIEKRNFISFDDSYFLLNIPKENNEGPRSREAAIDILTTLAANDTVYYSGIPSVLTPTIDVLTQLGNALDGILARRCTPNRTRAYHQQGGAVQPSFGDLGEALGSQRKKKRLSTASGGKLHGAATAGQSSRRPSRPHITLASGEQQQSTAIFTPYPDLNKHLDKLTSCISKLQTPSPSESVALQKTPNALDFPEIPPVIDSNTSPQLTADNDVSGKQTAQKSTTSTPISQPAALENDVGSAAVLQNAETRPRSSSHTSSMVSGASSEARKQRILVTEVPESSQYATLFGTNTYTERSLPRKPSIATQSTSSRISTGSDNHAGLGQVSSITGSLMNTLFKDGSSASERAESINTNYYSQNSGCHSISTTGTGGLVVTIQAITPASRQAMWLQVYTTTTDTKHSLWRRRQWHRRFGIFAGNTLYLFKSSAPAATALSYLRLTSSSIVCVNDSFPGRKWVLEITQPRNDPIGITSDNVSRMSQSIDRGNPLEPVSWFLQTEQRLEMVNLLRSLKASVKELQVQPDIERREQERLKERRKNQRHEARKNALVCPWEVDEFSDKSTSQSSNDESDKNDEAGDEISAYGTDYSNDALGDESSDELDHPRLGNIGVGDNSQALIFESYTMDPVTQLATQQQQQHNHGPHNRYTGAGGIAEWGAHKLRMPYDSMLSLTSMNMQRSYSTDHTANSGRRPSLADALAPPSSATQPTMPITPVSASLKGSGRPNMTSSGNTNNGRALRYSVAGSIISDASALIDQMFASASHELSVSSSPNQQPKQLEGTLDVGVNNGRQAGGTNCLSIVCEEDE